MTAPDREQIRRDAERFRNRQPNIFARDIATTLARHCLALLDALEQAERERDEALAQKVEKLSPQPGDLLVLTAPRKLTAETYEALRDQLRAVAPPNVQTAIIADSLSLELSEARLAAVPALVEALEQIANRTGRALGESSAVAYDALIAYHAAYQETTK